MKKIAIIGHSHIVALLNAIGEWRKPAKMDAGGGDDNGLTTSFRGWQSKDTGGKLFEITPREQFKNKFSGTKVSLLTEGTPGASPLAISRSQDGQTYIDMTPLMKTFLEDVADFDVVISIIHGGDHTMRSLLNDMPEYDFAPFENPEAGYCPIDIQYIDIVTRNALLDLVFSPLTAMRMMLPKTKLIHIAPPPPQEDLSTIRFRSKLDALINEYGFLRPSLRLKWYFNYISHLRQITSQQQITLIEPSKACLSEAGFLRPDYSEGDLAHGNVEYGRLVASRIAELI